LLPTSSKQDTFSDRLAAILLYAKNIIIIIIIIIIIMHIDRCGHNRGQECHAKGSRKRN
jgi:hypothetical protein